MGAGLVWPILPASLPKALPQTPGYRNIAV